MLIIWGEKQATRKLGYAADHCPACQATRAIELKRVGMAPHFFWIPFGKGRLLGYYGVCQTCNSELNVGPTDYQSFVKKQPDTLSELTSTTNPRLEPGNRDAIESYERFRRLRDPLMQAELGLQERGAKGMRLDWTSGLTFLASIVVPGLILSIDTSSFDYETQQAIGSVAFWLFVIGIISAVVLLAREPTRYFRRELEPEILSHLREVNPRRDELEACLKLIKKYEYKVAGFVSANRLLDRMQTSHLSFQ